MTLGQDRALLPVTGSLLQVPDAVDTAAGHPARGTSPWLDLVRLVTCYREMLSMLFMHRESNDMLQSNMQDMFGTKPDSDGQKYAHCSSSCDLRVVAHQYAYVAMVCAKCCLAAALHQCTELINAGKCSTRLRPGFRMPLFEPMNSKGS